MVRLPRGWFALVVCGFPNFLEGEGFETFDYWRKASVSFEQLERLVLVRRVSHGCFF